MHTVAWIYTKEDCHLYEDGEIDEVNTIEDPELIERIFNDVGNIDYIYTAIQECVDEVTEEQFMSISTRTRVTVCKVSTFGWNGFVFVYSIRVKEKHLT